MFKAPKGTDVMEFSGGYAYFSYKGKIGFINKKGKVVIKPTGYGVGYFSEGLAVWAKDSEKYGYINTKGKTVIPLKYESAYDFSEGLACVQEKGKYGFINKKGKMVISAIYDLSLIHI